MPASPRPGVHPCSLQVFSTALTVKVSLFSSVSALWRGSSSASGRPSVLCVFLAAVLAPQLLSFLGLMLDGQVGSLSLRLIGLPGRADHVLLRLLWAQHLCSQRLAVGS